MNNDPLSSDAFTAWANQLLAYQRQYQNAWQAFSPKSPTISFNGASASDSNPWVVALEQWWETVKSSVTPPVQDFYGKLVDQGKAYFYITDGLSSAFQAGAVTGASATEWQEAVNTALSGFKDAFSGRNDMQGAAQQAMAFWELPLNNWKRAVSSLSVFPGDVLQGVNTSNLERVRDEMHGRVDQLLSTPAVGHMREHQEQFQTLAKLTLDYQQALHDYSATFSELGVKCLEALQEQVHQRVEAGKQISSLRELYDLWVDSCEQAYAAHATTDEYAQLYGRLVNSVMALKRHGGMMVDEILGALNMPTRGEIDTLHGRLHEMRWEGKTVRAEINAMKDQLQTLTKRDETTQNEKALRTEVKDMNDQLQTLVTKQGADSKPKQPAGGSNKSASSKSSAKKTDGFPKQDPRPRGRPARVNNH
jgi:polyhydroxyalkanoate synthase subunit PhaE